MPTLAIADLPVNHPLERGAMSSIRGGGAPWVFGWIRPYLPEQAGTGPGAVFVQVNNYYADQMINQIQVVNVSNSAANSAIDVGLDEKGSNSRPRPPAAA